jgi:formylglycine-generating enzyme required for sulfatase activity
VVVSQLAWFNLEWTGKPDAGSPPTAAPGAPQNGGWGILSRTGDETNSAGTPDWSHDGLTIAYTSTSPLVGTRDGRLQGPAEGGVGGAGVPVLGTSADIKTIPYTASASVGGAGGPATGLTGASDPSYNEYYPAFSPDDKLLAFNRVPYTASMYNQPLTQVYLVPFNQGDGGPPVRLVANDPVSCTGLASPGVQNTWPKWAPNPQTIDGKTYYWVSFFSTRSVAAGATPGAAGLMQLFVAGVVVDNATGNVITFAPIYPWNQDGTVDNLMAVWGDFSLPAGTTPPPSPICDGGSCVPGCVIDGLFYASGATTGDGCQICQPETNLTAWTNVSGAGSCRAGDVCNAGSCSPGCSVDGTFYPSGATANNGCEICQPGTSTTALVDVTGAARCPQGEVCSAGSCTPGCSIGGVFYGSGDVAVDDCEMCEPTTSATTWTDVSGGNCLLPKSCNQTGPGMTTCPGGSGTDSCCSSLEVTAAAQRLTQFYRTYLSSGTVTFDEADPATVSNFRLDEYLVTVGRFRQFVNAVLPPDSGTGWMPAPGSGKQTLLNRGSGLLNSATELPDSGPESYEMGWESDWSVDIDPTDQNLECSPNSTWTDPVSTQESLPINCVNWYEAYAFCIWDGGFLPSEAEWEFAAAGGILQREYPWGSAAPGTTNQYAIYGGYYAGNSIGIARVGSSAMGVGYWGQLDLAGELGEWTLDGYAAYVDPCVDCAYLPMAATARVVRGGNFLSATTELSPATRLEYGPLVRRSDVGVRCARSL